jgi:Domain of unknown function (DUF397)
MTDHTFIGWRKAQASGPDDNCVEVAFDTANGLVGVRDSKRPTGPTLIFTGVEWDAFLAGAQAGEFDRPKRPGLLPH